jgi:hypothetical protein
MAWFLAVCALDNSYKLPNTGTPHTVIPAEAGTQPWVPAFAGMTNEVGTSYARYAFGSRTTKRAPSTLPPGSRRFSAAIRPRSASTICRLIDRPRPEC